MSHSKSESFNHLKEKAINYLKANKYLALLFILCLGTSLIFCLNEFPTGADIPSHYIKIVNIRDMLEDGKFIRWSYDWYCGYTIFDTYPPLVYVLVTALSLVVNDIALAMKIFTIASFSSFSLLLYRLGRVLGRSSKGATSLALLFSLTPLNILFLFNGYFIFIFSLALMFIFLTEFFRYIQNGNKTSFLVSIGMLTIIAMTYHRTLYFLLFILFFHFILKIYRRQIREATSTALMVIIGVGGSSFWLFPALIDMLTFKSEELYQSLIIEATHGGLNFQAISMLFIVPYCYLVYKRMREKKIKSDSELVLLLSLVFFAILALGPYGPLYYLIPFSSSQRPEISLLIVTLFASILASKLFDEKIIAGRRTFKGILVASLLFLSLMNGIFFYPKIVLGLRPIDFTYSRGELNDSLVNMVNNAYVEQQVFLGKNDEDFIEVLRYISNDNREGRVVFYSNRSQSVDMFYYYALLPLSGKSTPQGIAPEGEVDLKWDVYTSRIIWQLNETLLKLSGTRWVISNYQLVFDSDLPYKVFGRYRLYELVDVKMLMGCEGTVHYSIGEIRLILSQECRDLTFAESYNPRWRVYDQDGRAIKVTCTEYGFMRVTSENNLREVHLVYSDTVIDVLGRVISVVCLILFSVLCLLMNYGSSIRLSNIKKWH